MAEIAEKLSKDYSKISRLGHIVENPLLLRYYITYVKPVIGYGLLIIGYASKTWLKPIF